MKLDKRSNQPLYSQLKDLLNDRIKSGTYLPGSQIPSELTLCEELTLSRPTVRQAIAELVAEGTLAIVKGKGTFVAAEPDRIDIKGFNAFGFSFLSARELDGFGELSICKIEASPDIERIFGPAQNIGHSEFWSVQWQLEETSKVFAICESIIPVFMFPELFEDLKQNRRMIDITANKYAYLPQKANCQIFVRPIKIEEARQLDVARNATVLVATSRLTSKSANVCEYVTAVLRADLVTLGLDAGRS